MKHLLRFSAACLVLLAGATQAQTPNRPPAAPTTEKKADEPPFDVREHYTKYEYRIPMRDGAKLFTAVYVPKDQSKPYPFLMVRTPYSVSVADGATARTLRRGPFPAQHAASRAVGGLRPGGIHLRVSGRARAVRVGGQIRRDDPAPRRQEIPADVDPSSDMHDTVDWLLKNVPNNNGRVGIWGISYPGLLHGGEHHRLASRDQGRVAPGADDQPLRQGRRRVPRRRVHAGGELFVLQCRSARRTTRPRNRASGRRSSTARTTATSSSSSRARSAR